MTFWGGAVEMCLTVACLANALKPILGTHTHGVLRGPEKQRAVRGPATCFVSGQKCCLLDLELTYDVTLMYLLSLPAREPLISTL
jgi:hypothetical protein